jgi:ADP-ribosyl-[dinitrogen reductase] hydrolase
MRALPVGWVIPHSQPKRRRQVAIEMSRATHPDPSAQVAACVIAACASWALEGAQPQLLIDIAVEEAREAALVTAASPRLADVLSQISSRLWRAPSEGVSLDPYETVSAVLYCLVEATTLRQAMTSAVQLGGDTDTVAALVGGLLGSQLTPDEIRAELSWCEAVLLPEPDEHVLDVSETLATARAVLAD